MSNVMSYAEQEEICFQWLRFRPQMTAEEATKAFKAVFAITLTQSNYTQAKARLSALPLKPKTEKQKYLVALGTCYPDLPLKQIKTKCLLFFGEDVRDDIAEHWRKFAGEFPMDHTEARGIIETCEQRRAGGQEAFALDEPLDGEKEVDL